MDTELNIEMKVTFGERELHEALYEYILAHPDLDARLRGKLHISKVESVEPSFNPPFQLQEVTVTLSNLL